MRYIYVTSESEKDILLSLGFELIKTHSNNKLFVFRYENETQKFSQIEDGLAERGVCYVLSDMLTF